MSRTAFMLFRMIYSPDEQGQYGVQALCRAIAILLIAGDYHE